VLRLEAIRYAAVRPDADLACGEEPASVWRHLDISDCTWRLVGRWRKGCAS
jgi:hypothetical protein